MTVQAEISVFNGNMAQTEALFRAIEEANVARVKSLLRKGADVHLELPFSKGKGTALHAAALQSSGTKIAELLIKAKADVNKRNHENRTPLHFAVLHCAKVCMVYFLIDEGANVSAQDDNGQTPIHLVAEHPNHDFRIAIAAALYEAGADLSCRDKAGRIPLELAEHKGPFLCSFFRHNEPVDHQQVKDQGYIPKFRNGGIIRHFFRLKIVDKRQISHSVKMGIMRLLERLGIFVLFDLCPSLKVNSWRLFERVQPGRLRSWVLRAAYTRDLYILHLLLNLDCMDHIIASKQLHTLLIELGGDTQKSFLCQFWEEVDQEKVEACFRRANLDGDETIVKWIVQSRRNSAKPRTPNEQDFQHEVSKAIDDCDCEQIELIVGQGGLHRLLQQGQLALCSRALDFMKKQEVDPEILTKKFETLTLLELACKLGKEGIFEQIHGMEPSLLKESDVFKVTTSRSIYKKIADLEPDMFRKANRKGLTMAHYLATSKEPEDQLLSIAREYRVDGSLLVSDHRGISPVQLAIENNHLQLTRYFLDCKSELAYVGCPSLLWLCAMTNNVEAAEILLEYLPGTDIEKPAPDSSTPRLVAQAMKHVDIVELLENGTSSAGMKKLSCGHAAKEIPSAGVTPLQELTHTIPLFNENVSKNWTGHVEPDQPGFHLEDATAPFVLEVCGLKDVSSNENLVRQLVPHLRKCQGTHENQTSNATCPLISALIQYLSTLEEYLREKPVFKSLDPCFTLIGSIMESTRLGLGNEIDCQIEFRQLKPSYFALGETAFGVKLTPEGRKCFEAAGLDHLADGDCFDHALFLRSLFATLLEAINETERPSGLTIAMQNEDYDGKACIECCKATEKKFASSEYPAQCHCMNCLPAVTMTRLGPCLIFHWQGTKEASSVLCSIDLIPVFPLGVSTQQAFNKMVQTLVQIQPEGWEESFRKYLCRDRILSYPRDESSSSEGTTNFAFKIQHFGPSNNYIVRAGQGLDRDALEDPLMKWVYISLKGLKEMLSVSELKSFFIKKVLLKPEITEFGSQQPNKLQLFYEVINQPELRLFLEDALNYDNLKAGLMKGKSTIVLNRKYRSTDQ